ncbi:deaminase [Tersicoccus solisilvae]|uniref:Deaminase n=1 Tax=Tersicoccus solisilvae TaxID=1882339 RepID=A0ABQ1NK10_9MICC|nr:dihydrofolate reductase family protein [Tersicoccus solisilvae]GGC79234.1 deaminase [Tersicoccus solisilvae]
MTRLVYLVAISLDGFIADPHGDFSAFPTPPAYLDHLVERFPQTIPTHVRTALRLPVPRGRFSSVLMGWSTYAVGLPVGVTSPYQHLHQVVASRGRRRDVPDEIEVTRDPVTTVTRLRAADDGDIWLCGGGSLAAALADEIDELILKINPITLGAGIPLFADPAAEPRSWAASDVVSLPTGHVVASYARP